MMKAMTYARAAVLLSVSWSCCVTQAFAHSVGADAYVREGGVVTVEAWTGGGVTAETGRVTVFGEDGSVLERGELTDGSWSFEPERAQRFGFLVELGPGHAKRFQLHPAELEKLKGMLGREEPGGGSSGAGPVPEKDAGARRPAGRGPPWLGAVTGILIIALIAALLRIRQLGRELALLRREKEEGP